jgi:hypothetical protein
MFGSNFVLGDKSAKEQTENVKEEKPYGQENITLELDDINKHECMKNIKRTFMRMQ